MTKHIYICSAGDYKTDDPSDAHFDDPGHEAAVSQLINGMDENTHNVFQHSAADKVKEELDLPDKCRSTITINGSTYECRRHHMNGGTIHGALMNSDDGIGMEITWG